MRSRVPSTAVRRWLGILVPVAVATSLFLVGGCSTEKARTTGNDAAAAPSSPPPPPEARITITPAHGGKRARPDKGITVQVADGKLTDVEVTSKGAAVRGRLDAAATTWRSTWTLEPGRAYTVEASAVNSAGTPTTATAKFTTLTPAATFGASVQIATGETYGVGMPIVVDFSQPIFNKAAVERALEVESSPRVEGAWAWHGDYQVRFRPKRYWPAHAKVRFTGHLSGVRGAKNVYGVDDVGVNFQIGDQVISEASVTKHQMTIRKNGKVIKTWPISTGKPGFDTDGGTFMILERGNPVRMRSASFGITDKKDPDYYDLKVYWAVRFSYSGNYTHSAPWSVGDQGVRNVSHGCVNLSPARAEWFYETALRGDIIKVVDAKQQVPYGDGWTDWMLSFDDWVERSALDRSITTGRL